MQTVITGAVFGTAAKVFQKEAAPDAWESFPCRLYEAISDKDDRLDVRMDWHAYPEILYFRHGSYRLVVNLEEYEINEECLCFINPDELHCVEILSEKGAEYALSFRFDMLQFLRQDECQRDLLEPLLERKLCIGRFITVSHFGFLEILKVMDGIVKRFRDMGVRSDAGSGSRRYQLRTNYDQLIIKADLLRLLAVLEANGMIKTASALEEEKQVRIIKDSLRFIRENYARKIYIRDLAALNDLNEQYFIRFFGSVIGTSPMEYINRYRVERARELLESPGMHAYEVAEACGFHNIGNFIKIFRSFTGLTPHKYRKSLRIGEGA